MITAGGLDSLVREAEEQFAGRFGQSAAGSWLPRAAST